MPRLSLGILLVALVSGSSHTTGADESAPTRPEARRVPWTTSRLHGSPEPPAPYVTEPAFPKLSFQQPVELVAIPGTNRLAAVELKGAVYSFENRADVRNGQRDLFVDVATLHPKFHRAYALTFHPRFAENRTCFLAYVLPAGTADGTRVSRFRVTATDPPRIDPASEEVLITWVSGGHNGTHLQFGPDGYLYISTGDASDPFPPDIRNTGQNIGDLLSSILRIDVDRAEAGRRYRIPSDNPFVGTPGARGEVWAYGLRNPWRMCFDPADGSLWVGDVGWELWEMIYRIERGGNYGWSLVEGRQPVHRERTRGPTPILPPTVELSHIESRSVTGGYVVQSDRLPELRGAYVFGDYVTGKVWALRHDAGRVTWQAELTDTPFQIVSFGLDHQGDLYLVDYAGSLHRLVPNPRRTANADFPRRLSDTGLFAATAEHRPAPGVVPYRIHAEPWADGTVAERFVALPGTSRLDTYAKTDVQIGYIAGEWKFPTDGVLAKTISLETVPGQASSRRRLETQVLHFDVDTWRAYNYVWNDDQTDAMLADADGFQRSYVVHDPSAPGGQRKQTWQHAGRTECLTCHTTRAGSIHGFRVPQLRGASDNPGGNGAADQLRALEALGLFLQSVPEKPAAWVDPYDAAAPLDQRARAYLHVNCAHCHRRGGGGTAPFDVQITTDLARANLLDTRPTQGTFDIPGAQLVVPGAPFKSVLLYRVSKLGHGRMPQFGSRVVDERGVRLLHDWIASLPSERSTAPATSDLDDWRTATDDERRLAAVTRLSASTSGALQLAFAVAASKADEPAARVAIRAGATHANPIVRDLFERFVPEDQRVQRLGSVIRPAEILALPGDGERGRKLFFDTAGVQCRNCHRIGPEGKSVGPELTQIGKKLDKPKLLESLLEPSRTIDPQFVTYLVETTAGQVQTGLLVRRDDTEIVLRRADGQEVRIAAGDVELFAPQQKSLMPDLLLQDLTAQQVADLLEYLATRK